MGWLGDEPVACISVVAYGDAYGFLGFYICRPEFRKRFLRQLNGKSEARERQIRNPKHEIRNKQKNDKLPNDETRRSARQRVA